MVWIESAVHCLTTKHCQISLCRRAGMCSFTGLVTATTCISYHY